MGKKEVNTTGNPLPPKRPLAPFFLYKGEVYETVKKENPTKPMTELTRIIAQQWGQIDEATKKRLEAIHQKNKVQYEKDKAEHEAKYGKTEKKQKIKKDKKKVDSKKKK